MFKIFMAFAVFVTVLLSATGTVYAETDPSVLRIGLLRGFSNRDSVIIQNNNITVGRGFPDGSFRPIQDLHSGVGFTVRVVGGLVTLSHGGNTVFTFVGDADGAPQIRDSAQGKISMGGYLFRGRMEFSPSGGRFTAINVLYMDDYLKGVVPSEMSPSFHIEALKAQAVAARTFAIHSVGLGRHRREGFDLCNRYCCQVYNGASREYDITTQAVLETSGLMMFYDDEIILAAYFSSSGGNTDNSENVWFDALPYLRGVAEIVPEHEPMVWTRNFSWAQLTQAAASAGANIGNVTAIDITRVASGGRVQELTFVGTNGTWRRNREDVRNVFNSIGGVPSRNFSINGLSPTSEAVHATDGITSVHTPLSDMQVIGRGGAVTTLSDAYIFDGADTRHIQSNPVRIAGGTGITVNGSGWGHGVGMSQRGAEGMARAGFNFRQILLHYYTGVEIR